MSVTQINYKAEGELATILMTPPEGKPPTIDGEVLGWLERCIQQAREEKPRVLLVRSASERFFCVGANIQVLKETDEHSIVPWVMNGHRILNLLEDLPMPVIAVVEGYAMGGGLELAMACDLIFASDKAQLAQSEAGLGFIPGWGGTRRLKERVGPAKAKHLFYSGDTLDAFRAAEIGLVDFASDKVELEKELERYTAKILGNSANALSQFKTILNNNEQRARDENSAVEAFRSVSCLQDADTKKRLYDFLNRKKSK